MLEPSWIYPDPPSIFIVILVALISALIFLFSGLTLTLPLLIKGYLSKKYFMVASLVASCTFGVIFYYIFLVNNEIGKFLCIVLYAGCAYTLVAILRKRTALFQKHKAALTPLMIVVFLCFSLGLFSNLLLFGCERVGVVSTKNQFCGIRDSTFDNTLPLSFSLSTYDGIRKSYVSDWKSSDRPPMQNGIFVTQLPILSHVGKTEINYQILSVFLQTLWIAAIVELLRLFKVKMKLYAPVLIIAFTNTFMFMNTLFVWPKLLAATFIVFAVVILINSIKDKKFTLESTILIALCVAAGLLSHGAVLFTVVPLLFLGIVAGYRYLNLRKITLLLLVTGILYTPWYLYQSVYFGPTDRLVKWWIAGKLSVDDTSALRSVYEAYSVPSTGDIVQLKVDNLKLIAGVTPYYETENDDNAFALFRQAERNYFLPSLSFSLIGAVVGFWYLVRRYKKNQRLVLLKGKSSFILGLSFLSLLFWAVASYGLPYAPTTAHAGSYATFLLVLFIFIYQLTKIKLLLWTIAILSTLHFLYINVALLREPDSALSVVYLISASLMLIFVAVATKLSGILESSRTTY